MDKHYSEIYSHDYSEDMKNQLFRYNYESHRLEKVCVPDEEMLADLKKDLKSSIGWLKAEAQADLKSYEETGYVVITAEGLSKESWEEAKDYYMDMMCENIAYEISDAIKEFAPELIEKEGKEMKTTKNTSLASELNELAKGLDYYEYMDNYNSEEEGLQYFTESLNNQEQTKAILTHLRESQEETPDIWGPKELEVLQHLEKYASQQFPDMAIGSKQNENIAMKVVYAKDLKPSYVDSRNNKVYKSIEEISVATGMTQKEAYKEVNHPYGIFKKIYQAEGITVPDVVYRKSKVHNIPMVLKNGSMWYIPDKSEIQNIEISEEDITKLVAAGDWHIDKNDHERFAAADDPRVTGSIGYVSFGNYIYDFRCQDFTPGTSNFAVDVCELRPAKDIGQTTHKFFQDGMPYTFEAIDVDDLEEKYLPGMSAYVIMERNDFNSGSLENFKRDVVKALATGGAEHQKPLIDAKYTEKYASLKEYGGFPQFYEKQKKILEHLREYECNPQSVYSFLPEDTTQLLYKDKLSPDQIDTLGSYYEHFRECYHDNCLDFAANQRLVVRKMADDGLDDSKIMMINDSIFERFIKYRSSGPKPVFKKIVSDLIKETRAANAARWNVNSKNFAK